MANDNETVESAVADLRFLGGELHLRSYLTPGEIHNLSHMLESKAEEIEAAHKREMDHRALIAGVSLADAVDDAHKRELAAKDREIAELRECLKDAVRLHCDNLDGDCLHCIRCGVCNYLKWREALKGAKDEH